MSNAADECIRSGSDAEEDTMRNRFLALAAGMMVATLPVMAFAATPDVSVTATAPRILVGNDKPRVIADFQRAAHLLRPASHATNLQGNVWVENGEVNLLNDASYFGKGGPVDANAGVLGTVVQAHSDLEQGKRHLAVTGLHEAVSILRNAAIA